MDVEEIQKNQDMTSQIYQERISFLMSREKEQVCASYIDITDNRMLAIEADGRRLQEKDSKNVDVYQWLQKYIYPYIAYEEDLEEFKTEFRRKKLQEYFAEGKTFLEYHHSYRNHGQIMLYDIQINMFQNPDNDHIELCVIWKDDTRNYIDTEIRKILYQRDCKALGLIGIGNGSLYFRSHHFKEMEIPVETSLSYEKVVCQMEEKRIAPKSRELFLKCTALEYLSDNLEFAGQHSFEIYNVENKVERYTYYWFDHRKKILLFVVDDMTKELETDAVTGLLNRQGFSRKAQEIIEKNPKIRFAVLYCNIQRFKAINDLFGYEMGDMILRDVANTYQTSFLKPLALARMEADKFVMLVDSKNLQLEKLPQLLHGVYAKQEIRIDLYGRCGIYYVPEDMALQVSDMCDRAKLAKSYIPNQYVKPYAVFNEQMKEDYEQRSRALIQLDDALKGEEIKVYYQPIYDAWTREVVAAEALVRWYSPKNGVILPGKFIPVLEESGHITKLDTFVYQHVQEFQQKRSETGKKVVRVTVNLSRMDLMDETIMNLILDDVHSKQQLKEKISFEVTESAYAAIAEIGTHFMNQLKEAGVNILIDDFGNGASSFSTIRDFDFNIIKLDMGFVQKLGESKKNNNILISLIDLAHRLNMKVVAEGVETEGQADFLKNCGCDYLQGFYFSRPLTQEDFEKTLDQHPSHDASEGR